MDCSLLNGQLDGLPNRFGYAFGNGSRTIRDIDWDGNNTSLLTSYSPPRMFKCSGRFSSIIRQSAALPTSSAQWNGFCTISDSEQRVETLVTKYLRAGTQQYRMSGHFTQVVHDTHDFGAGIMNRIQSCSFDGTDTLLGGETPSFRMIRVSGVFSSTILDSLTVASRAHGICSLNFEGRLFPRTPDIFGGRTFIVETEERLTQVTELHDEATLVDLEDSRQFQVAPLETA